MRGNSATYRYAALVVLLLGGYLELIEWVNLGAWNNPGGQDVGLFLYRNPQSTLDIGIGIVSLFLAGGLWAAWAPAAAVGLVLCGYWIWLQVETFWLPYINGARPAWSRVYEVWFAPLTQWLPGDANHLPPPADHLVLQAILIIALLAQLRALFSVRRAPAPNAPTGN